MNLHPSDYRALSLSYGTTSALEVAWSGPKNELESSARITIILKPLSGKLITLNFTEVVSEQFYNPTEKPGFSLSAAQKSLNGKLSVAYQLDSLPEGLIRFEAEMIARNGSRYFATTVASVTDFGRGDFRGADAKDLYRMHF